VSVKRAYSLQCAVCSVQCAVCSVQCAVCSVQCAVYNVQCAVCSVQCSVPRELALVCEMHNAMCAEMHCIGLSTKKHVETFEINAGRQLWWTGHVPFPKTAEEITILNWSPSTEYYCVHWWERSGTADELRIQLQTSVLPFFPSLGRREFASAGGREEPRAGRLHLLCLTCNRIKIRWAH
jgi:hypothetical protein